MGPRKENLDLGTDFLDVDNDGPDAISRLVMLAGDLLGTRQERFHMFNVNDQRSPLITLHRSADEHALLGHVLVVNRLALRFPYLLNNELLGPVCGYPAKRFRIKALLSLQSRNLPRVAVDLHLHFLTRPEVFPGRRLKGRFYSLEDYFLVDILVPVKAINKSQYLFALHAPSPDSQKGTFSPDRENIQNPRPRSPLTNSDIQPRKPTKRLLCRFKTELL